MVNKSGARVGMCCGGAQKKSSLLVGARDRYGD
jgi:hypothetical protein